MSLEGKVTTIIIAHRINTVKNVKNIYFMDNGKILSAGSYEFLQKSIPEFDNWVQELNSETISWSGLQEFNLRCHHRRIQILMAFHLAIPTNKCSQISFARHAIRANFINRGWVPI